MLWRESFERLNLENTRGCERRKRRRWAGIWQWDLGERGEGVD
jgi:hypothetical protein